MTFIVDPEPKVQESDVSGAPPDYFSSQFNYSLRNVHIKKTTQILGVLEMFLNIYYFASLFVLEKACPVERNVMIFLFLINVIAFSFLFLGLKKEKSELLLPYLLIKVTWILILIIYMGFCLFVFMNPHSSMKSVVFYDNDELPDPKDENYNSTVREWIVLNSHSYIAEVIITVCCFLVVRRCYQYFKELAKFRGQIDITMKYPLYVDF